MNQLDPVLLAAVAERAEESGRSLASEHRLMLGKAMDQLRKQRYMRTLDATLCAQRQLAGVQNSA